jgi:aspartyl-tRNA(Asn)/glutamyl-tRNA(Gln) amidotransferase subunit A
MSDEISFLPVTDLVEAFRDKRLSPVEAMRAVFDRIHRYQSAINAFTLTCEQDALAAARESEARWSKGAPLGALDGVPISVKDTLMAKGFPFRRGSKATPTAPAMESAPIVDRCLEQGAIIIGITTTPEFGAGPVTISPLTGITRNPWDLNKNAGGSSGGAAASVAAGMCYVGLATDAGGSIRIPSAFCGTVGFKVTGGLIPIHPPSAAGPLSCNGPIVRSARELPLLLRIFTAFDERDPEAFIPAGLDFEKAVAGVKGKRIAFSRTLGYAAHVDAQVADRVEAAVRVLEGQGAIVEACDPGISDPIGVYLKLFYSGFAYAARNFTPEQFDLMGEVLRGVVTEGRKLTLADYLEAHDARRALARKMQQFHRKYDLLITPTVAVPAFAADRWFPEEFANASNTRAWTPYGYPFNLTQQPAVSIPCGFTDQGLPVGLQIVGRRFGDTDVLEAALAYEAAQPSAIHRPRL